MFTCQICYIEFPNRFLMPNSSKGCDCSAQYCVPCFVKDFPTRVRHIELIPNTTGETNNNGIITATVDTHWESREELIYYLLDRFEESIENEDIEDEDLPALADQYIKERMKFGRNCPFCRKLGVWNIGDEPHVLDGRLQLTAPIYTFHVPQST